MAWMLPMYWRATCFSASAIATIVVWHKVAASMSGNHVGRHYHRKCNSCIGPKWAAIPVRIPTDLYSIPYRGRALFLHNAPRNSIRLPSNSLQTGAISKRFRCYRAALGKTLPLGAAAIGDHRRSGIIPDDKLASVSDAIDAALPYLFGVSPARAAFQARGAGSPNGVRTELRQLSSDDAHR